MNAEHPPDFHAWLVRTAQLLREHRWDELDAEQLAEAVEDLLDEDWLPDAAD